MPEGVYMEMMIINSKKGDNTFLQYTLPFRHWPLTSYQAEWEPGRHNLRSFLAEKSTQNYFLIARMFSFCDIRDKNAVFNILRQNVTNFDIGNG